VFGNFVITLIHQNLVRIEHVVTHKMFCIEFHRFLAWRKFAAFGQNLGKGPPMENSIKFLSLLAEQFKSRKLLNFNPLPFFPFFLLDKDRGYWTQFWEETFQPLQM